MDKWEIYFWEPVVSPHKLDFYNALSRSADVASMLYVAQNDLPAERKAQGWGVGELGAAQVIVNPSNTRIAEIVARSSPRSLHLFSGIHWVPCIMLGLEAVLAAGRRFAIMSEPRVFEGVRGWARYAHSWLTEAHVRRHASFVLAIGCHGPPWFKSVGYAERKIFPFAYFLPGMDLSDMGDGAAEEAGRGARARLTFLGRLERSKGIRLFLDALPLISRECAVVVAGVGSECAVVEEAAKTSGSPFAYHGAVPMRNVPALLAQTDILLAPSTTNDDGWGAVVSEALMAGACVVASDHIGASVCLGSDARGLVARPLTPGNLARACEWLIDNGRLSRSYRLQRSAWAHKRLTGAAGANYLLSILDHVFNGAPRPAPFYADAPLHTLSASIAPAAVGCGKII